MRIDFHTHLLPAIDDGSQSVAESLNMLDALRLQNVHCAVATPHFYSNKANLTDFLNQRDKAYEMLLSKCSQEMPKVIPGAEVAFFRGMGKAEDLTKLCIANTNALLIEMPFVQWGQSELSEIEKILNRGILPVLAHIERYFPFQRDVSIFNEIINLPLYLQVNAEAMQMRRSRKFVFKLIENGFSVLLGTDCHNMKRRKPNMEEGRAAIAKAFGRSYLQSMDAVGADLLKIGDPSDFAESGV